MKQAVVVIDVQQGLCVGSEAAHDCSGTIAKINTVTRKARRIDVPVIFVQHEGENGYLEYQSQSWELAEGLELASSDLKVRKATPDSFHKTQLLSLLQDLNVEKLVVCGMHTEFCIDTTVRRALALGFPVTLVADAHTSAGNSAITAVQVIAHHNATLQNISSFGPRVVAVNATEVNFALSRTNRP
jgi:nicotinamidase-related amidase